jgi:hypothetical protein
LHLSDGRNGFNELSIITVGSFGGSTGLIGGWVDLFTGLKSGILKAFKGLKSAFDALLDVLLDELLGMSIGGTFGVLFSALLGTLFDEVFIGGVNAFDKIEIT